MFYQKKKRGMGNIEDSGSAMLANASAVPDNNGTHDADQ